MKKAVIYATKSGTCEEMAKLVAKNLTDCDIFDIKKQTPNLKDYDIVIIGGAYYAGMLTGKLKKFIKNHKQEIKSKKYAFFISSVDNDNYVDILKKNVGEDMVKGAVDVKWFGYGASIEKAKGLNKLVTRIMINALKKQNKPTTIINEDDIKAFAKKLEQTK